MIHILDFNDIFGQVPQDIRSTATVMISHDNDWILVLNHVSIKLCFECCWFIRFDLLCRMTLSFQSHRSCMIVS